MKLKTNYKFESFKDSKTKTWYKINKIKLSEKNAKLAIIETNSILNNLI